MQGTRLRGAVSGKVSGTGRWMRLWTDKSAAELVEFAVVIPLLFMVLFGMWWFGRAFNIYETLTRAAREGAVFGARTNGALDANRCGTENPPAFPCSAEIESKVLAPALKASAINVADLATIPKPNVRSCARGSFDPTSPCPVSGSQTKATCYTPSDDGSNKIWVCRCVDMAPNNLSGSNPECGVSITMAYPWKWRFPFTGLDGIVINIPASVQERQEF